jgi:hypothetical protein
MEKKRKDLAKANGIPDVKPEKKKKKPAPPAASPPASSPKPKAKKPEILRQASPVPVEGAPRAASPTNTPGDGKKSRTADNLRCGNCGQMGHIRTAKKCPEYFTKGPGAKSASSPPPEGKSGSPKKE